MFHVQIAKSLILLYTGYTNVQQKVKGGMKKEELQLNDEKENQNNDPDQLSDQELLELALKPLADPVVEAIFTNEDVAGLAAQSLVNAVLEIDGDPPMGKITRLTAQKTVSNILHRGYRLENSYD